MTSCADAILTGSGAHAWSGGNPPAAESAPAAGGPAPGKSDPASCPLGGFMCVSERVIGTKWQRGTRGLPQAGNGRGDATGWAPRKVWGVDRMELSQPARGQVRAPP